MSRQRWTIEKLSVLGVDADGELVNEIFHLVTVWQIVFQSLWEVLQVYDPQVAVQAV